MGRWKPDAVGRLERAALELYLARGFEQVIFNVLVTQFVNQ